MQEVIDFAKGPLFAATFVFMILGLFRHVIIQIYSLFITKGARLKYVPWKSIFKDMSGWILPVNHMIKGTAIFSAASFLFHIGIILLALFLTDHVVLWEKILGVGLPEIGRAAADAITIATMFLIGVLFFSRIFIRRLRSMSKTADFMILIMVGLPVFFGFLAGKPSLNPLTWEWAMLLHLLTAETLFVIIPFTKLAHIVLYFFDRLSPVHWQLRPGAGDKVAEALFGKEAKV